MVPSEHLVGLADLRLNVRQWSSEGPAVVLVHGLSSNSHVWDAVAPRLAAQFRVVALDQRGHGRSDKPDEGYDFDTIVADLRGLVEALGLSRPIVVGHSWGGNVVLQHAAANPDEVAGLVLVDGGFIELADDPAMTWERVERELAPPDLTALTFGELRERVRGREAGAYWSEAVEATLRGSFAIESDGRIAPRLTLANHLRILRAMWEQRPSRLYAHVRCPVLIVPARRDGSDADGDEPRARRERQVAAAAAAIPSARVLWMDDTVHDVPLHRPEELAAAIARFAERTYPPTPPPCEGRGS
jgi:pimeloyl-ACP methyl ester carboxylesterase